MSTPAGRNLDNESKDAYKDAYNRQQRMLIL